LAGIDVDLLSRVLGIVVIDLVLSGDNAVVIGLAARRLGPRDRRRAIFWGGVGAIGLRVLFTALTAVLLGIPALQFLGGLLLVWIAFKLLREEPAAERGEGVREGETLVDAVRTIVLADVIMSLDNILAVGGVAHGDLALLLFGLGLSMPLILFGSGLVALLTERLPWLVYVGSGVLVWTAADMMAEDMLLGAYIPHLGTPIEPFPLVLTLGSLGLGYLMNRRQHRRAEAAPALRDERDAA
jgi:YjbE family integral membrane protein